jgi:hypothetical protein
VDRKESPLDRTAFRVVDWDEHVAEHDERWLDYWLSQPITARLAGAMPAGGVVHGPAAAAGSLVASA